MVGVGLGGPDTVGHGLDSRLQKILISRINDNHLLKYSNISRILWLESRKGGIVIFGYDPSETPRRGQCGQRYSHGDGAWRTQFNCGCGPGGALGVLDCQLQVECTIILQLSILT